MTLKYGGTTISPQMLTLNNNVSNKHVIQAVKIRFPVSVKKIKPQNYSIERIHGIAHR
jgi:hypothetical protein